MKSAVIVISCVLAFVAVAAAQTPGRIQTSTRLVVIFSNLENQLNDALASGNSVGVARLLTDDFEEWTPQPPGSPVPREDWLKAAGRQLADARVLQMAVKDLGEHAVADFVLVAGNKAFFVVDVWQKQGAEWRLQQRYQSPVDLAPFRHPLRPSGKD